MRHVRCALLLAACAVSLAACGNGENSAGLDDGLGDPESASAVQAKCADTQKSYVGFAGSKLEVGRVEASPGSDRSRMKPYAALVDDYQRVVQNVPTVLNESGPTFGDAPARWYSEPLPGAVNLYQAYRVAFEGCLEYTKTDAKWDTAPTRETASAECSAMARKFWSRTPSSDEVNGCVEVAVTDSAKEQVAGKGAQDTSARRRWSYACAAVLTASSFLMY